MKRSAPAESLRDAYLRMDPRTLGFGRIFLALVLIGDLLRRIPWLRDFYSNAGLIPNHTVLWRPPFPRVFSVFFMASLPEESALLFGVCFFVFFCFLIGYRTRLFQVLSFVMTTSLHNRILFAENWGGVAIGALMVWTMFLPLGRRFSVDAVLASLRARPEETPADLAAGVSPPDDRPAASLAVLGLLLQIAVIYWFNFVHKSGPTWRHGTAIYYVLHQERIVTSLAVWVRAHAPFALLKLLTHSTLVIEAAAPVLILTPILWRWTRPLAVVLLVGMHTSIAMLVNLGIFSAAMIAYDPFLLTDAQWRWFGRLVPKRGRARTVFYDADCGVCYLIVRVLARLDVHRRLRWLPNRDTAALPAGVEPALLERTMLVVDPARDRRWTRADGLAEILGALPFGRLWAWPLRLPGLGALAGWAYDSFARNRTRISLWLGLSGCAVPGAPRPPGPTVPAPAIPPTPFRAWLRARAVVVRELAVGLVFVIIRRRDLGGQPLRAALAPLRAPPRVDGGCGHVSAPVRGLVAVLARRAGLRRDRVRRRGDARRAPRRSLQRGGEPGLRPSRSTGCRSGSAMIRSGATSRSASRTAPSITRRSSNGSSGTRSEPGIPRTPSSASRPIPSGRTARARGRASRPTSARSASCNGRERDRPARPAAGSRVAARRRPAAGSRVAARRRPAAGSRVAARRRPAAGHPASPPAAGPPPDPASPPAAARRRIPRRRPPSARRRIARRSRRPPPARRLLRSRRPQSRGGGAGCGGASSSAT